MTPTPSTSSGAALHRRPVPVNDEQRQQAADLVVEAAGAGVLELQAADDQLAAVYRAQDQHDLSAVQAQLPAGWLDSRRQQQRVVQAQQVAKDALRRHVAAYLAGMTLMIAIWLAVGLAAGAWYPWPVWPALGWGLGVHCHARAASGSGRRRGAWGAGCGADRALPPGGVRA